jgi:UDP-2-acetamido-3-amino-2,3-dideoxy-glucuronate N-acetyltransferase
VTKNVPEYALVGGVPAHHMGWMCRCGEKLEFRNKEASCFACATRYMLSQDGQTCSQVKSEDATPHYSERGLS